MHTAIQHVDQDNFMSTINNHKINDVDQEIISDKDLVRLAGLEAYLHLKEETEIVIDDKNLHS